MKPFVTFFLSLFLISLTANAQQPSGDTKGHIINETGHGLEAVSVSLINAKDSSLIGTSSGSEVLTPFEKMGFGETKANNINIKVVRGFVKFFKTVKNNKWFLAEDGSSNSTFNYDGIKTIVEYDSKGCRRYIMRVYEENKLSFDIGDMVKREYYDATITLVTEVETHNGRVTYVHLQDKETWKKVKVADGEMKLVENFKKG